MKVICVGHAAYDITIPVDIFPTENTKNRVNNRVECGGGPASNAAYLLAKWGIETSFAGVIGKDLYGSRIKQELNDIGVNIKYLEENPDYETTSSFIIANSSSGSRTIFTYRPIDMHMNDIEIDFKPDVILIDGQEPAISEKLIRQFPEAISVIDAGRPKEEIIKLAKMVNYVICSKEFAEEVTGKTVDYDKLSTIADIYNSLKSEFKNNVIFTLEDRGSVYQDSDNVNIMPSLKVKAIDSTAAGDIFHGAFVYGITQGYDLPKIIKYANIAGAISVTRLGGRFSIPTLEEVKEKYDTLK
jgi:sugar/nucleoside kinase (ribokinase family)